MHTEITSEMKCFERDCFEFYVTPTMTTGTGTPGHRLYLIEKVSSRTGETKHSFYIWGNSHEEALHRYFEHHPITR